MRSFFLIALIYSFPLTVGAEKPAPPVFYRVLHASPQEISSALFSPMSQPPPKTKVKNLPGSRLAKYFRVKNKTIRNHQVTLELIPVIPQIENYLPSTKPIQISITQSSSLKNHYKFDSLITLSSGYFFNALIELSPHESGSLLKLKLRETNVSKSLLKLFTVTALQLGFLSETPDSARQNDKTLSQ